MDLLLKRPIRSQKAALWSKSNQNRNIHDLRTQLSRLCDDPWAIGLQNDADSGFLHRFGR